MFLLALMALGGTGDLGNPPLITGTDRMDLFLNFVSGEIDFHFCEVRHNSTTRYILTVFKVRDELSSRFRRVE